MKQQINFRASGLTARQLNELAQRWGTTQSETLTVCIDRIYQQEMSMEQQFTVKRGSAVSPLRWPCLPDEGEDE
jgi:hypothetical protein